MSAEKAITVRVNGKNYDEFKLIIKSFKVPFKEWINGKVKEGVKELKKVKKQSETITYLRIKKENTKTIQVYINEKKYNKLISLLHDSGFSFTFWLERKIEGDLKELTELTNKINKLINKQ